MGKLCFFLLLLYAEKKQINSFPSGYGWALIQKCKSLQLFPSWCEKECTVQPGWCILSTNKGQCTLQTVYLNMSFCLNIRKDFLMWEWLSTGTRCPGRQWSLHAWRYLKVIWTWSWAISSRWPCLSRGFELGDLHRSLPTSTLLWSCVYGPQVVIAITLSGQKEKSFVSRGVLFFNRPIMLLGKKNMARALNRCFHHILWT